MKMRALDTFHTSTTRTVQAGAEFEIHAVMGRDLEKAGLAVVVDAGADEEPVIKEEEPAVKQEPTPDNKMAPAPANKRGPGRPRKAEPVEAEEPDEGAE